MTTTPPKGQEPEALRLADALERCWGDSRLDDAAAELRRLHAQVTALTASQPAQQGGAYAELPNFDDGNEPIWNAIFNWKSATPGADAAQKAMKIDSAIIAQMRDFADRTHALRASPQPVREPLTPEQIAEGFASRSRSVGLFAGGVRFAERHHGIKGGQT